MRLPGESEERNSGLSMKYMIIGTVLCLALILGVVAVTNKQNADRKKKAAEQEQTVMALEHENGATNGEETETAENGTQTQNANTTGTADTVEADSTGAEGTIDTNVTDTDTTANAVVNTAENIDGAGNGSTADNTYAAESTNTAGSAAANGNASDNTYATESTDTTGNGNASDNTYATESTNTAANVNASANTDATTANKTTNGSATSNDETGSNTTVNSTDGDNDTTGNNDTTDNSAGSSTDTESASNESVSPSAVTNYSGRKSLEEIERLYRENKLRASDLDFWDMYPEEGRKKSSPSSYIEENAMAERQKDRAEKAIAEEAKREENEAEEKPKDKYSKYDEAAEKEAKEDPSKDGKHTLIKKADGTEEWVLINPYLEQNSYDFSKLQKKSGQKLYYRDGRNSSYLGVDISKENEEVDFSMLKENGIDFVMIRIGSRGYGSGQVMLDEKYSEHISKAQEAGLDIGVYFNSQAISKDEAIEEANVVMHNLVNYKLTYPIVFDMEYVQNDRARTDSLTREERTVIAKAFLDTVKAGGYKTMIYGTKEWLIKQVDLTKLTNYDVWLSAKQDEPDYPYMFQMWQYSAEGNVGGISGDVNMNLCFVDYSEK